MIPAIPSIALGALVSKFRSALARFGRSEHGNVATIFVVALIPILGFVGAAIDYSRTSNARTAMQAALDATALMVAKDDSAGTLTAAQLTTKAQAYFTALYTGHPEVSNINFTATYSSGTSAGSTIAVTGSGTLQTTFMNIVGFPTMSFNVSSTSAWGTTKLRVALVLDNTGSMAQAGKLTALQSAASNLVDQLSSSAQNNGDVYISLIPFAKDVNVGASNYAQSWVDFTQWWNANNQTCSGPWYNQTCTTNNHNTWTGCVMDRQQSYDTTNTTPTSAATDFPADEYYENGQYYCKPGNNPQLQQIVPLSYNWTSLKSSINAMQATGGTNQSIGLQWGWMSLSQVSPLNAPALDPNYTYVQAIILLSDGLNTEDRWYGDGTTWSSQVDARQMILCDNIKAAGIKIYAIQVNTDGEAQSAVMNYCASGSQNFFYLTSASQVLTAFNSIGASLSKLRIAK